MTEQELIKLAEEKLQESIENCAQITAFEAEPITFEIALRLVKADLARKEAKKAKSKKRRVWTDENFQHAFDAENEED